MMIYSTVIKQNKPLESNILYNTDYIQPSSFMILIISITMPQFISKILLTHRFISSVITLSQCPITIPDCRLNSRIPRFNWPLYQSYDAPDKSTTRQDFRYIEEYTGRHMIFFLNFLRCEFICFYKNLIRITFPNIRTSLRKNVFYLFGI